MARNKVVGSKTLAGLMAESNISKQFKKDSVTHVFNFSSLFKLIFSPHVLKAALNSAFFASFMKVHEIKIHSQAFVCRHFLRRS
jgi:hypothetical protein